MLFSAHPKSELTKFLNAYKSASSRLIKKEFPEIRQKLWKEYFWSRSFCLISTYREKDHDLLMSIRGGEYQKEDGTYRQEFFDLLNEYEKRMRYAEKNTSLPAGPDLKRIEEFVEEVNLESLQH